MLSTLAFYAVRGIRPSDLAGCSDAELAFLAAARGIYYDEISAILRQIGGQQ